VRPAHPRASPLSPELVGFVLLGVFFVAIFIGFPVAFTLICLSLAFGYFAQRHGLLPDRAATIGLMKEVFAAVPLFIFMGYLWRKAASWSGSSAPFSCW
jgi:TRAP-type mannitol/chloroaromatic compound transport system permease large subunit